MNLWNFKSASTISNDEFEMFEKCFPENTLHFDELIETLIYLSKSVVTKYFYIICTSTKHYLFINCNEEDYKKNHERIMDITKNKYNLVLLKTRIRESFQ
jgi:hypothetical protein